MAGASESELRPVYANGAPGAPIELYNGPIAVDDADPLPGRIYADLAGDLQVRWELTEAGRALQSPHVTLGIEVSDIGSTRVPVGLTNSTGRGLIMDANIGSLDAPCERVVTHFTNLPAIFPGTRWSTSAGEWHLTLQERPDYSDVINQLKSGNKLFFVVTHVGEIRRTDGSSFPAAEGAAVIEAWQVALSFVLARYVAPVAPVGFDANGHRVWEQWASWRCDRMFGYLPWWDVRDGNDLKAYVKLMVEAWLNPQEREAVEHVSRHLIAAHHISTTMEAKIMLVHAALEYLSWVTYVLPPGTRTPSHHDRNDMLTGAPPAVWHLQELLSDAGIDTAIPPGLVAMTGRAEEMEPSARPNQVIDGPEVLTWLRGRLVHPKDAGEPYRIEDLITEAWRLVTEYGDLLLLHRIGYKGKYLPRTDTGEWLRSVPVPWAI